MIVGAAIGLIVLGMLALLTYAALRQLLEDYRRRHRRGGTLTFEHWGRSRG